MTQARSIPLPSSLDPTSRPGDDDTSTSPMSRLLGLSLDVKNLNPISNSSGNASHHRFSSTSSARSTGSNTWQELAEQDPTGKGLTPLPSPIAPQSSGGRRTHDFFSTAFALPSPAPSSRFFDSPSNQHPPLRTKLSRDPLLPDSPSPAGRSPSLLASLQPPPPSDPSVPHPLPRPRSRPPSVNLDSPLALHPPHPFPLASTSHVPSPLAPPPDPNVRQRAGMTVGLGRAAPPSGSDSLAMPYNPPSRFPTLLGSHHRPKPKERNPDPPDFVHQRLSLDGGERRRSEDLPRSESPVPTDSRPASPLPSTLLHDPSIAEGQMLGTDYRIERALGQGAFSRVVLARRVADRGGALEGTEAETRGDLFAVKLMDRKQCEANPRLKISVVREIEVLKHIHHPNLVHLLQSFDTDLFNCLVLEYAPGGELFDLLASSHALFTEPFIRRVFGELVDVVDWMHSIGLVHRDIKLENILLTSRLFQNGQPLTDLSQLPSPIVKLTDFGLSRFINFSDPVLETRCGSEEYAAPELILGRLYDGRQTDAWALGVILYSLATGFLPFVSPAPASVPTTRRSYLMKIAKADYVWPEAPTSAPGQNPDLRYVVHRLLVRDPSKRAGAEDLWAMPWMDGPGLPQRRSRNEAEVWVKAGDGPEIDRAVRAEAV